LRGGQGYRQASQQVAHRPRPIFRRKRRILLHPAHNLGDQSFFDVGFAGLSFKGGDELVNAAHHAFVVVTARRFIL
jgi:hypothetical protein